MNLHKAKGLEAAVVVLDYPVKPSEHEPSRHIERREDGRALGYLRICNAAERKSSVLALRMRLPVPRKSSVLALPRDWQAHAEAERVFEAAEGIRLMDVAATRAKEELVITRYDATKDHSVWAIFHDALDDPAIATKLEVEAEDPPARERAEASGEEMANAVQQTEVALQRLMPKTFDIASVTSR